MKKLIKFNTSKKFLSLIICFVLALTFFPTSRVFATPSDNKIDKAIQERNQISSELEEKNNQLEIIGENNVMLGKEIKAKEAELIVINNRITENEQKVEKLKQSVSKLAVNYYKNGTNSSAQIFLETILQSKNFGDALIAIEYATRAYQQEAALLDDIQKESAALISDRQNQIILSQNLSLFQQQYRQEQTEIKKRVKELKQLAKDNQEVLDALHANERIEQLKYLELITSELNTEGEISEARKKVVATALDQLGKPYVWGATGPNSFDCSGLMLFSYKSIGINIVRTSRAQYAMTLRVELKDLKPGDLVFIGNTPSSIHHVMMYIGGGYTVEAPQTGDVVKIRPLKPRLSSVCGYGSVFKDEPEKTLPKSKSTDK